MGRRRISERGIAADAGRLVYHSTPCVYGHNDGRYTKTGACVTCARAASLAYKRRIAQRVEAAREELEKAGAA